MANNHMFIHYIYSYIIAFSHWHKTSSNLTSDDSNLMLVGLWCSTPLSTIFQLYRSVLLVEETGVPVENHRSVSSHWQTLSYIVVLRTPCHEHGFEHTTLMVLGTDCTVSCKSNYYMIPSKSTYQCLILVKLSRI